MSKSEDIPKATDSTAKRAGARRWATWAFIGILVFAVIAVATNFASEHVFHKSDATADSHATAAATVMEHSNLEVPTTTAAYKVVGMVGDTTIAALEADGTTYNGTVILRITVSNDNGPLGSSDYTQRCYLYKFTHSAAGLTPQLLNTCPNLPVLKLAQPADTPIQPST